MKFIKILPVVCALLIICSVAYSESKAAAGNKKSLKQKKASSDTLKKTKDSSDTKTKTPILAPKVTFIELGANKCIPCKMMQPIMKELEEEYPVEVKVVFYDVWEDGAPAEKYGIKLIPTQVFLDKDGKEFFRHEGFFPKEEILKVLAKQGVKVKK